MIHSITIMKTEQVKVKGRFALGIWKNILSNQYSISQINMDVTDARCAHDLPLHMPDRRTAPATPQPAPVMDRYSGLRSASNSFKTSHACRAAVKRVRPHAVSINTVHSSRVTPKERFEGMNQVYWNRIRSILRKKRKLILDRVQCYLSKVFVTKQSFLCNGGILEWEGLIHYWFEFSCHNKIHDLLEVIECAHGGADNA